MLVAMGLAGLAVGALGVAALTVDLRPAHPVALTVDSFPREVLGETREDVALRDGGSKAILERLDVQFGKQLTAYRFAFGGDGARFHYGDQLQLTIVNGRMPPTVPVSDDSFAWEAPTVVTLKSRDTSCISEEPRGEIVPSEPGGAEAPTIVKNESELTDCVLVDAERNVSLRLVGRDPLGAEDILITAGRFRDELEHIHADLLD